MKGEKRSRKSTQRTWCLDINRSAYSSLPFALLVLGLGFEVSVKQLVFSSSRAENALGSLHRLSARSRTTSSEAMCCTETNRRNFAKCLPSGVLMYKTCYRVGLMGCDVDELKGEPESFRELFLEKWY